MRINAFLTLSNLYARLNPLLLFVFLFFMLTSFPALVIRFPEDHFYIVIGFLIFLSGAFYFLNRKISDGSRVYAQAFRLSVIGFSEDQALSIARRESKSSSLGACEKAWWEDFKSAHRDQIAQFSCDLDACLVRDFRILSGVRVWDRGGEFSDFVGFDEAMVFLGRGVDECAKAIHAKALDNGRDGSPLIFSDEYVSDFRSRMNSFSLLFHQIVFDRYMVKFSSFCFWLFLALFLYSIKFAFLGPYVPLYVPSVPWILSGSFIALILTLLVFLIMDHNSARERFLSRSAWFSYPIVIGALFASSWSVVMGGGEIAVFLTSFSEKPRIFLVEKDMDTSKSVKVFKHSHEVDAYCLILQRQFFFSSEYCVDKVHYDSVPEWGADFQFSVLESPFGFVVTGYYFPLPGPGVVPRKVE